MDYTGIPADGPETTLGQAARRLKLRYSRTYVARAVASHPKSGSLLALVEVAKDLGIKTTAGRMEAADLGELDYPTIVHFGGAEGGGFGVLEGATADGFKVWDSVNGLQVIERAAFLSSWSGIVALVERADEPGRPERNYWRNRMTELVFSGYEPPALVGSRAALPLRVLFGALIIPLLALSAADLTGEDRVAAGAIAVLAGAGLMVTILTGVSIAAQDSSLSDRVCARGKLVDCHSVLSSRYSRVFGIALSDIGIAFFGAVVLLIAAGGVATGQSVWAAIAIVFGASVPLSLVLVGVQIAMRQLCTLCLAVHTVNFSAAAIAWIWLAPERWSAHGVVSSLLLLSLFFVMLLFLAIPYFRKHQGLRVLAGMHRRISGSPFASLAEILTEKPSGLVESDSAIALEGPGAEHDLAVFVHPSCGKCDPALQAVKALAQTGMVNAYVGVSPKDPDESDRRACAAVVAVGLAHGPARVIEAYAAAKKHWGSMTAADPIEILAGEMQLARGPIDESFEDAQRRTRKAEEIVDAHAEGTPALFFNSRLYRGEIGHLVFLLERHAALLGPTRRDLTERASS